jgi:arylsulfatase A-like enzyme
MIPRLDSRMRTARKAATAAAAVAAILLLGASRCSRAERAEPAVWTERRGPSPSGTASASAPDILVVLVDALRADHLGCYGYARATSPALDRWARSAALFTRAYAQATHTRMSVASLFTGSRPTVHRIRQVDLPADDDGSGAVMTTDALSEKFTCLAESLDAAGYETWGFSANPHVSSELGFDQGFTSFQETRNRRGSEMTERFLEAWERRPRGPGAPPLFAYLHLMSVHNPYDPPPPFSAAFTVPGKGRVIYRNGPADPSPGDLSFTMALYDGGILYTDSLLERLLARWEAPGGRPHLVIVLSDHGEEFLDHGGLGHGTTAYAELARIVLLVKAPAVPPGTFEAPVTMVDVNRLILDLAGASAPPHAQGRPFSSWLAPSGTPPIVYTESRTAWAGYRSGGRALIFARDDPSRAMWFDMGADPREQHPFKDAATIERMRAELERALSGDDALAVALAAPDRRPLRNETMEVLKGLGYAGG